MVAVSLTRDHLAAAATLSLCVSDAESP
eukprot:COSAG02_NODE_20112_length_848_cov_0.803738_1_plen_27_part_10